MKQQCVFREMYHPNSPPPNLSPTFKHLKFRPSIFSSYPFPTVMQSMGYYNVRFWAHDVKYRTSCAQVHELPQSWKSHLYSFYHLNS